MARRERGAYPLCYVTSEQGSQQVCEPQPRGARRRAGICFVAAPRRCTGASTASRRLAPACPALAPYVIIFMGRDTKSLAHSWITSNLLETPASHINVALARFPRLLSKCMKYINGFSNPGDIDHSPLAEYMNANFLNPGPDLPHWFPVAGFQSVLNSAEIESCGTPGLQPENFGDHPSSNLQISAASCLLNTII